MGARQDEAPLVAAPLGAGMAVGSEPVIEAWARPCVARPRVYLRVDGRVVQATRDPYRLRWQLVELSPGRHRVEVLAYDDAGRKVGSAGGSLRVTGR